MVEVVAALVGAIIGSAITLVYSSVREHLALRREQKIINNALLAEGELKLELLKTLQSSYKYLGGISPVRFSLDLYEHALLRHMTALGNLKLIAQLSQLIIDARSLNSALDRYEPELLKAMEDTRRKPNVENMRVAICKNIGVCSIALENVRKVLKDS